MKQRCNLGKGWIKLNHLLFVDDFKLYDGSQADIDSLIQTVYTVTDDVDMWFGIGKCWFLAICRGKKSECAI